jgi:hypothetical protein
VLLFKTSLLSHEEIKGFSLAAYPIRGMNIRTILLYLKNGQKFEFPQFMLFNFKKVRAALIDNRISFLGAEAPA